MLFGNFWNNLYIIYYFRYHKSHVTCRESNQCWKSKLPKCYCQGCLKTFQTHFESLLMIRMFEHRVLLCLKAEKSIKKPLPIKVKAFSFSAKPNTGDNPYRKLLNLKLFCNLFMKRYKLYQNIDVWKKDKFRANNCFYRQPWTINIWAKIKNWSRRDQDILIFAFA